MRELYRAISEIPETANEKELKANQEVAKEWKSMEEMQEVNSADQIDQLDDLRLEMKSGNFNLSSSKVGTFRKRNAWSAKRNPEGGNVP